jgi:molybdenum cofactor cytidylyltransferase
MVAAIVLAAGSSSRMAPSRATGPEATGPSGGRQRPSAAGTSAAAGTAPGMSQPAESKALFPLGNLTAIERVVGSLLEAGADDVVVVTGHAAAEVAPVVKELGARPAHNAGYQQGMFSSVQTGVRALAPSEDPFFVLPVDCALVKPAVLGSLMEHHRQMAGAGRGVVYYPVCHGRRGHPPLISFVYRDEILRAEAQETGGLQDFLQRCSVQEVEVEVEDLTILIDMDTLEDYERVARLAQYLDAGRTTGVSAGGSRGSVARDLPLGLSDDDSRYLRALLCPPEELILHAEAVAAAGTVLARSVHEHLPSIDVQLVRSACLLHDLVKGGHRHAAMAEQLLTNLGLYRLAEVVGAHMSMPPEKLHTAALNEEQLVYLADKLVVGDQVAGVEERAARSMAKQVGNPDGLQAAKARTEVAWTIAGKVESLLGRPLQEVVLDATSYLSRIVAED